MYNILYFYIKRVVSIYKINKKKSHFVKQHIIMMEFKYDYYLSICTIF